MNDNNNNVTELIIPSLPPKTGPVDAYTLVALLNAIPQPVFSHPVPDDMPNGFFGKWRIEDGDIRCDVGNVSYIFGKEFDNRMRKLEAAGITENEAMSTVGVYIERVKQTLSDNSFSTPEE